MLWCVCELCVCCGVYVSCVCCDMCVSCFVCAVVGVYELCVLWCVCIHRHALSGEVWGSSRRVASKVTGSIGIRSSLRSEM